MRGIAVSHFQGQIDWPKVAGGGISFCYVKATDGVAFSDVRFLANYSGSKDTGLLIGAYHFLRPEMNAEQQAESFLHLLPQFGIGELPPVLDVEWAGGADAATIIDAVQTWVEAVENVLLRRPIIYTLASFWNSALGATRQFDDHSCGLPTTAQGSPLVCRSAARATSYGSFQRRDRYLELQVRLT